MFIITSDNLICSVVEVPKRFNDIEVCCIDITLENITQRYICVYDPPNCKSDYMQKLCDCLQVLVDVKHEVILLSDFNLPNIAWFDNAYPTGLCETLFYDFATNNGFSHFVESATYSINVLNLVFCNDPLGVLNCNVGEPFSNSDHGSILFSTWFPILNHYSQKTISKKYFFDLGDYNTIACSLNNTDWDCLFSRLTDINSIWSAFKEVLCTHIDQYIPYYEISSSKKKVYPLHIKRWLAKKKMAWHDRFKPRGGE